MIKPGYIRLIDGKVKFEYYELEKPDKKNYYGTTASDYYIYAMQKYEASKRTIEVSNVVKESINVWYFHPTELNIIVLKNGERVKINQNCKAEVNGKATIVELIK